MSETRRHPIRWVAVVVGVAIAGLLLVLATRTPAGTKVSSPLVGRTAPALRGTGIDGKPVDLSRMRGTWVLVNFFASWCAPCQAEHSELVEFSKRHQGGEASVISVAFNDNEADIKAFFAKRGGDWPVVVGDTDGIALDYGVVKLPESYLVAPDGQIVAKLISGITADEVDSLIRRYTADADTTTTVAPGG